MGSPYYRGPAAPLLHGATLLVSLVAWQACRRAGALPLGVLSGIDAASVTLVITGFAAQAVLLPRAFAGEVARSLVLVLTHVVVVRAVLVPSSAARTAAVSLVAALPAAAAIGWLPAPPGAGPAVAVNDRFWSWLWTACAIVVATLVSHVIYGLRAEIREARRLGQYTLEEKLGEGGMGAVYRARHAMLRRPTAVKLLRPDRGGRHDVARFEREVQTTAQLSHPNTVAIYDYGRTPDGVFYYAMEYLEGIDLDRLVREFGPQPPGRVVHVLAQVAGALDEAHSVGLIHRDVKPGNVILCRRGGAPDVAKVVDFGLVRDLTAQGVGTESGLDVVTGTPLYLSPEAITAPDRVDGRSDLYALGAVGYFLLSGRHPFEGATVVEVCAHHLHTAPEPPSLLLGRPLPPDLERVLLACLEKDREKRPRDAAELQDALVACRCAEEWGERDARRWWRENAARVREATAHAPRSRDGSPLPTVAVSLEERLAARGSPA